ncbi:MAG: dynamin family protein [Pseudomonadota bacterium]
MQAATDAIESRLHHLEKHLAQENPVLLKAVQSFRKLDRVAQRMGLLPWEESFATRISWWPLIAILGTFSAGKSTFINSYLGQKLQRTGNQAVDDRFTVICYSHEQTSYALPGVALDADPRFPFFRVSRDIEQVAAGEGVRIDAYLQLKTCASENLRGKILIDSPGFDADSQRDSTLRLTEHIVDLSDLVLVLFDARHPEPGAMRDTLEHLVARTIHRPDAGKFLFILNQIDTAAREDNPEEVIAAWQRSLGDKGLTTGRYYAVYDREASVPIDDPTLKERFERKRDVDSEEIYGRIRQVGVERAYRIVGTLEKTARDIQDKAVPALNEALAQWHRLVLRWDAVILGIGTLVFLYLHLSGALKGPLRILESVLGSNFWYGLGGLMAVLALVVHFTFRTLMTHWVAKQLRQRPPLFSVGNALTQAFLYNTRSIHSLFFATPKGWGGRARGHIRDVLQDTNRYVQQLNDRFTNPSGVSRHE